MARPIRHSDPANKRLFSHQRMVADLIRLLGDWVDDLDLDRVERLPAEHVTRDLRKRLADMPWWVPFKNPPPGSAEGEPRAAGSGARPAGAGVLFHMEFQSSPNAHMAERLLEYVALLRRDLRHSGWTSAAGGRVVADVPLVVYNGRAKWSAPLRLDGRAWAPLILHDLQPRMAYWLVDAKDFAGDDAADGNLARAVLALDAASADGLEAALERAATLLSAVDDQELWLSFVAWCGGVLDPSLADRVLTLADNKEATMLAETLRERDELKIDEGRREGRQEGRREGRQEGRREGRQEGRQETLEEERALLCSQASRRFGAAIGTELADVLANVEDGTELARIGTLIIDCSTGPDFLARARRH